MSRITWNVISNFVGKAWSVGIALFATPLYVRYLGVEAYGLVGFYASLQGILSVLELGLGTTLSRELARLSGLHDDKHRQEMRDLVRTFGAVFVLAGVVLGVLIVGFAPVMATHWIHAEKLPPAAVTRAVALMGLVFAMQWPLGLFFGALMSLQRQVVGNGIMVGTATLRALGALAVLRFVSPTIDAFFLTQTLAAALQGAATLIALSRLLPQTGRGPRFQKTLFRAHWRFAAGMGTIMILGMALQQADKVVVSKLLSLEEFGYYSIGALVGAQVQAVVGPIFGAFFPRYCQALVQDPEALRVMYHRSCQLVSVLVLPVVCMLVAFPHEVLWAWTGDPKVSSRAAGVLVCIALGTAMNGLMLLPYALQLAHGWTRLTIYVNLVSIVIIIPLELTGAKLFGSVGAAAGWAVLNAGYILFEIPLMHRRLFRGEAARWYIQDVGLPLVAALAATSVAKLLLHPDWSRLGLVAGLGGFGMLTLLVTAMAAPETRTYLRTRMNHWILRPRPQSEG